MSEPGLPKRFEISGVRIDALRVHDTVELIERFIREGRREYIVLTGAHGVVEMQSDEELRAINNRATLVTPDGMPVVWIGRLHGHRGIEKVYAPDIMALELERGVARGHKHFFYGGKEGVAEKLTRRLETRFPGIAVVGTYCPPFRALTEEEADSLVALIDASGADVVWCGLGCPKQERWMAQFRPRLRAPVLIGVGAGFDFLSGEKPLAPKWVQRSGFEWLYRMASEPRRLWPRYSRVVPKFVYFAARDGLHRLIAGR